MKINNKQVTMILVVLAALVILPNMLPASMVTDDGVSDRETIYQDGLFGSKVNRVTLDNGIVTYEKDYAWYSAEALKESFLHSFNIYGIEGSSSSNVMYLTETYPFEPVTVTFKQQNDLKMSSLWGYGDYVETTIGKSRLRVYEGIAGQDDELDSLTNNVVESVVSKDVHPYGQTWTTDIHVGGSYYDISEAGSYGYTIEETLYPEGSLIGVETDRAWVHLAVMEEPAQATSGEITVTVLDNLMCQPAHVAMYHDGHLVSTYYLDHGTYTYTNLDFGTYSFRVTDNDYTTWCYDAVPNQELQADYNLDVGVVQLSNDINHINYMICGIFDSTEESGKSGFDDGDWDKDIKSDVDEAVEDVKDVVPEIPSLSDVVGDAFGDDNDDDGSSLWDSLKLLLLGTGLFGASVLGLPVFLVVSFIVLIIAYFYTKK